MSYNGPNDGLPGSHLCHCSICLQNYKAPFATQALWRTAVGNAPYAGDDAKGKIAQIAECLGIAAKTVHRGVILGDTDIAHDRLNLLTAFAGPHGTALIKAKLIQIEAAKGGRSKTKAKACKSH